LDAATYVCTGGEERTLVVPLPRFHAYTSPTLTAEVFEILTSKGVHPEFGVKVKEGTGLGKRSTIKVSLEEHPNFVTCSTTCAVPGLAYTNGPGVKSVELAGALPDPKFHA
jgi:hypothetical protein